MHPPPSLHSFEYPLPPFLSASKYIKILVSVEICLGIALVCIFGAEGLLNFELFWASDFNMAKATEPASLDDLLCGSPLVNRQGKRLSLEDAIGDAEYVAIYFSAHWCPPCRSFTPRLANWFTANAARHNTRLIFASRDNSAAEFQEYFNEMPWDLAFPLKSQIVTSLMNMWGIQGIPTLVRCRPAVFGVHASCSCGCSYSPASRGEAVSANDMLMSKMTTAGSRGQDRQAPDA